LFTGGLGDVQSAATVDVHEPQSSCHTGLNCTSFKFSEMPVGLAKKAV